MSSIHCSNIPISTAGNREYVVEHVDDVIEDKEEEEEDDEDDSESDAEDEIENDDDETIEDVIVVDFCSNVGFVVVWMSVKPVTCIKRSVLCEFIRIVVVSAIDGLSSCLLVRV
ncbi:hypothetical protein Tco_1177468 [Tanacetum coccineum]